MGQDTANGPYSFECIGGLSLPLRGTEANVCTGVIITDGIVPKDENGNHLYDEEGNVVIIDAMVAITAGQALTEDRPGFESDRWRLLDGLRFVLGNLEIRAESAVLEFQANELVSGELLGSPIEISDFVEESNTTISGTAETVTFDEDTFRMLGQTRFVVSGDERIELAGCDLVYDLSTSFLHIANATGSQESAGTNSCVGTGTSGRERPVGQEAPDQTDAP